MRLNLMNGRGAAGLVVLGLLGSVACGQDFVDRANAMYADIEQDQRSDLVLLPVLAKMDAPPQGVETVEKAALQPATSSPVWREAERWAEGEPQRAALAALDTVTSESDYRYAMAFGLPYGVEALVDEPGGIDIVSANLHVDLDVGGTPLLAGADFRYFSGIERLMCLVEVEATRLAAEGDVARALDVLGDGVFLARQLADRGFAQEMAYGIHLMDALLERMRDVVYVDLRGDRHLSDHPEALAGVIDRLGERTREGTAGYLGVERLRFPTLNRLGAEQLARHVLLPSRSARSNADRGWANPDTFVRTLAFLTSRGHPMMLMSQWPRWEQAMGEFQVPQESVLLRIEAIEDEYEGRWRLRDPHAPLMSQQTVYEQLVASGSPSLTLIRITMGPLV